MESVLEVLPVPVFRPCGSERAQNVGLNKPKCGSERAQVWGGDCMQDEAAMLRRALAESMKRITLLNSDSNAMVDRRIVVKLLVTFFERKQSPEVLALMSRMLGFSGRALNPVLPHSPLLSNRPCALSDLLVQNLVLLHGRAPFQYLN